MDTNQSALRGREGGREEGNDPFWKLSCAAVSAVGFTLRVRIVKITVHARVHVHVKWNRC